MHREVSVMHREVSVCIYSISSILALVCLNLCAPVSLLPVCLLLSILARDRQQETDSKRQTDSKRRLLSAVNKSSRAALVL